MTRIPWRPSSSRVWPTSGAVCLLGTSNPPVMCRMPFQVVFLSSSHLHRLLCAYKLLSVCPVTLVYGWCIKRCTQLSSCSRSCSDLELTSTEEDDRSPCCRLLDLQFVFPYSSFLTFFPRVNVPRAVCSYPFPY